MTRGDLLVAGILMGVLLLSWWPWWHMPTAGREVWIYQGNALYGRFPLEQERVLNIEGPLGYSEIHIEDGQARFVNSPCQNKVCIKAGWLKHGGEAAVCLPNRVSLQVHAEQPVFDSINF